MSEVGRKHGPFFCSFCGKEFRPNSRSVAKYCSVQCQKDMEFSNRYRSWVAGAHEKSERWVKRAVAHMCGYECSSCEISEWNGKPITLELDHIDGNHANNSVENVRLLCPNCHSQTETYKAKNTGNGRAFRRKLAA